MTCPTCGGDIIGDGYTSVHHCESANEQDYEYAAPDEGPFYCKESNEDKLRGAVKLLADGGKLYCHVSDYNQVTELFPNAVVIIDTIGGIKKGTVVAAKIPSYSMGREKY